MELLIETINQSLYSSKTRGIKQLRGRDPEAMLYITLYQLEYELGKTAPVQDKPKHRYWYADAPLTNIACKIGVGLLRGVEEIEDLSEEEIAKNRFRVGYHFIHLLTKEGLLEITKGRKKRDKYRVRVVKGAEDTIEGMLSIVDTIDPPVPIYTRPQFERPQPFTKFYHPAAGSLVRHNTKAREYMTVDAMPLVYDVINKHMDIAWNVNEHLLDVYKNCQEDNIFTHQKEVDLELLDEDQLVGLHRERDKVLEVATMVGDRKFWELMFYDYRGRLYSGATWLTHAGCKLSKSLFLYDERKPLTSEGYFWLLVHAANCRGWDKLSIDGRHNQAEKYLDAWFKIAKDPVKNKQWQCADSPFEFLAAITEIYNSHQHAGGPYDYPSGLPVAWDASCSGLQVLSALAKDEESGALCNLTASEKRGDYYRMIADHVWKEMTYTKEEEAQFAEVNAALVGFDKRTQKVFRSGTQEEKDALKEEKKIYKEENKEAIQASFRVYWGRLFNNRRSICKRPCMTYFYSCGVKSMAKAMLSDHGGDEDFLGLASTYAFMLANRIHKACQELMPVPTQLMNLFIELGLDAYGRDENLEVVAPYTKFRFIQNYRKDKLKQVQVEYKGKRIQPKVTIGKEVTIDRSKVMSATAPNIVHMLDAQIVAAIIMHADDYTVSSIHDSFSTHAADAGRLYHDCREVFVNLFGGDLLAEMLRDLNAEDYLNDVQYGKLDVNEVHDNEHNFS